ncbi:hypothetical protein ABPG74_010104 [Tetrahymena malaccensis]
MNRSRPRTYQYSQQFQRMSSYDEFAKLDNSNIQDVQNTQHSQQNYQNQENSQNFNNNLSQAINCNSSNLQPEVSASGKINSQNQENHITPPLLNPSNNIAAQGNNSSVSIFTTFSGPGQSALYSKLAFGSNGAFSDKGANSENPEKKRKIQGYSYLRIRHDQVLPKPEAYELRDQDIEFLTKLNKNYTQNLKTENPQKYEELIAQQKQRQEEAGDGNSILGVDEASGKSQQNNNNDATIILISEEQLERLFIHFEKKSTRDNTASFQEIMMDLPKEYEERLVHNELDECYQYWKREREREYERQGEKNTEKQKELYPFLRRYWRASTDEQNAHAAFRPREQIRMKTRKSARPENKETYEKMLSLEGDFKKYRVLALNLKKRELLKRELAYIQITEFNKSIPGLTNEFQIVNKFVSREQEIKQITSLIQPKLPKQVKPSRPKAPKAEQPSKEVPTSSQLKEQKADEIMNADESNTVQPVTEAPKKPIKISLTKLSDKNKFSDETKKVQANGELAEGEDASNLAKNLDDTSQQPVVEQKPKKKASKKKDLQKQAEINQEQQNIEEKQEQESQQQPAAVLPIEKPKKTKKKKEQKNQEENAQNQTALSAPEEGQPLTSSVNPNLETGNQDESEKAAQTTKKKTKKEKAEPKSVDPKEIAKKKTKKNSKKDQKAEEESKVAEENHLAHIALSPCLDKESQSIAHDIDQSTVNEKVREESSNLGTQKKQAQRKRKKQDLPAIDPEITANSEMIEETNKTLSINAQPAVSQQEVSQKNIPLIKLDKDIESAQFLSSFVIYFHQFKLPINFENVDSSEKIASKNLEMQEEKNKKLKNTNTLPYLIRKRLGRSNVSYIDRSFDQFNEVIGIQSGKISYLLTPHRNEIIYNTFNYVNPDAVKYVSSSSNPNNSLSQNPLSSSINSNLIVNGQISSNPGYDDEQYNKRESKSASDKKLKTLPSNEKQISEVREKQRQLFRNPLFQQKQEKIKAVIQQPYIQEMERRRKRTYFQAFYQSSRTQQLWVEDDDSGDHDEIFQKQVQSLKQTIEERQKEKEKKMKQQQRALAEQLRKQKEAEQKEEAARLLQQQKEEAQKQQELQQQQLQQQQLQQQQSFQPDLQKQQYIQQPLQSQYLNQQQSIQIPFNNNNSNIVNINDNSNNPNFNTNVNLSNQQFQEPMLYEQNSNQYNQPSLQMNQQSMNYYGNYERNSFDQPPNIVYGQSSQMMGQQGMDMMNNDDNLFSPMQMGQRPHQSSFQGGDIPQLSNIQGIPSTQPILNQNLSNNYQDMNYYYDNDDNNPFDNGFNPPNQDNNEFYNYQNDFMANDNDLENNYIAEDLNPNFMEDEL